MLWTSGLWLLLPLWGTTFAYVLAGKTSKPQDHLRASSFRWSKWLSSSPTQRFSAQLPSNWPPRCAFKARSVRVIIQLGIHQLEVTRCGSKGQVRSTWSRKPKEKVDCKELNLSLLFVIILEYLGISWNILDIFLSNLDIFLSNFEVGIQQPRTSSWRRDLIEPHLAWLGPRIILGVYCWRSYY